MPSNNKPVLSILVDGNKRDRFSDLCRRNGRPMSYAINQFIGRCLESDSIDCSPDYLGGGSNIARLPETLGYSEHEFKESGQKRGEQDFAPEIEDFDGVMDADEEFYDPEEEPEHSFVQEDIKDLPDEPPTASSEPREETAKEKWLREHEEHYGRPHLRR